VLVHPKAERRWAKVRSLGPPPKSFGNRSENPLDKVSAIGYYINMNTNKCSVCNNERDQYGLCHPNCPVMIAEDDQIRAEVEAAMNEPVDPELLKLANEVAGDVLALARFRRNLKGGN